MSEYVRSYDGNGCLGCHPPGFGLAGGGMGLELPSNVVSTIRSGISLQPIQTPTSSSGSSSTDVVLSSGAPSWLLPAGVALGGLAVTAGVMLLLKKMGKI